MISKNYCTLLLIEIQDMGNIWFFVSRYWKTSPARFTQWHSIQIWILSPYKIHGKKYFQFVFEVLCHSKSLAISRPETQNLYEWKFVTWNATNYLFYKSMQNI